MAILVFLSLSFVPRRNLAWARSDSRRAICRSLVLWVLFMRLSFSWKYPRAARIPPARAISRTVLFMVGFPRC